jgi:hypothetical protein
MSFNDKLKQAIDEIDLDRRMAELKGAAGELAREHGARLEEALGKVEATVDEKTKGKYADKLATARQKVTDTVATVAELPPAPAPETSPEADDRPDYRRRPPEELPPADGAVPPEHEPS